MKTSANTALVWLNIMRETKLFKQSNTILPTKFDVYKLPS